MVEALVAQTGESLSLGGDQRRREAARLDLRERRFASEERENGKDEPAAGVQVRGRASDDAIEDLPSIGAAVVGGCDGVVPIPRRRRRHLGRVGGNEIEALATN